MGVENINLPPFCNKCGMMIKIHSVFTYCSKCEIFRYKHKKLLLSKNPPVVSPRGVALAALRIEKINFPHEDWSKYENFSEAFTNDKKCIPNHLNELKSPYLLYEYLDAITEIMLSVPEKESYDWNNSMINSRTAILSEIKSCIYGNTGKKLEFDPFQEGKYLNEFKLIDLRIRSFLESMNSYVEDLYCCFECNAIGSKKILLNNNRTIFDKCSDCY